MLLNAGVEENPVGPAAVVEHSDVSLAEPRVWHRTRMNR